MKIDNAIALAEGKNSSPTAICPEAQNMPPGYHQPIWNGAPSGPFLTSGGTIWTRRHWSILALLTALLLGWVGYTGWLICKVHEQAIRLAESQVVIESMRDQQLPKQMAHH